MIRRPPRSTLSSSSAASDVYKRQVSTQSTGTFQCRTTAHCVRRSSADHITMGLLSALLPSEVFYGHRTTIIYSALLWYLIWWSLSSYTWTTVLVIVLLWAGGYLNRAEKDMLAQDLEVMRQALSVLASAREKMDSVQSLDAAKQELDRVRDLLSARSSVIEYTVPTTLSTLSVAADRAALKRSVLNSERVQKALRDTGSQPAEAERWFDTMAANQSIRLLQMLVALFKRSMAILFPLGIRVSNEQLANVRMAAHNDKAPIVFLPTHKSHMDYLTLHYMCYIGNLPIPHVVAGENLNLPFLGTILRMVGAFYIPRSFHGSELRKVVFQSYVRELLKQGHSIECFVEGGRSRSGKLLPPKAGFLRVLVDMVADGDIDDVLVLPVSLSYDRIVENASHIRELSGGKKKSERLTETIRSFVHLISGGWRARLSFGRVDVGVAEPLSLKKYIAEREKLKGDVAPASELDEKGRNRIAVSLGFSSLHQCNQVSTILPTAVVGTILLLHQERGLRHEDLVSRAVWLMDLISKRSGNVLPASDPHSMVNEVIERIMSGQSAALVKRHKQLLVCNFSPVERLELSTFRNQLIHCFAKEAAMALAIYSNFKTGGSRSGPRTLLKSDLMVGGEVLLKFLKYEFIFLPKEVRSREALEASFEATLDRLEESHVISPVQDTDGREFTMSATAETAPVSYTHLTLPTKRIV
eukprot:TRINITY_DN8118_c0_g2_i5.p1 TRINITY_DN8118_c0_g2~~TRINITY_DN8118_c0_g2_i5.p1  ORF type:complete len:698 (+),score=170.33 TRINITY_DN8118_c0_g2_i5:91-2184(+)